MSSCDPCGTIGPNGAPGGGGGGGPPATVTLQAALDGQNGLGVPTEQGYATIVDLNAGGSWAWRDAANAQIAQVADITGWTFSQQVRMAGTISPAALAAGTTNDYTPVGGATSNTQRWTPNAAGSRVTGLAGGAAGRMVTVINTSSTVPIELTNEGAGSAAANRFLTPNAITVYTIPPQGLVTLWYDGTSSRWRIINASVEIPGSFIWTFANAGVERGIVTTTNAVPFFYTWATLGAVGDAVDYQGILYYHDNNGLYCLFRNQAGGFARNAVGENGLVPVAAVTQSGYDESGGGTAPWNNLVNAPPGTNGGVNFAPGGGILQVAGNGAVGLTLTWRCIIIATPSNGTVISR